MSMGFQWSFEELSKEFESFKNFSTGVVQGYICELCQVVTWYQMATGNGCDPEVCNFLLVGNKVDLAHNRAVASTDGVALATNYRMNFFETSAKDATNVEKAFEELIHMIHNDNKRSGYAQKPTDNRVKLAEGRPVAVNEDNPISGGKKTACCK